MQDGYHSHLHKMELANICLGLMRAIDSQRKMDVSEIVISKTNKNEQMVMDSKMALVDL